MPDLQIENALVTSTRNEDTQTNLFGESSRHDEKMRFRTTNQAYNPNPDQKFAKRNNPYEYKPFI